MESIVAAMDLLHVTYEVVDESECASGGCQTGLAVVGTGDLALSSIKAGFNLGRNTNGLWLGKLFIAEQYMRPELSTPAALQLITQGTSMDVVNDPSTGLYRQIKAPMCLADIQVTDTYKYRIDFYGTNGYGQSKVGGFYPVTNGTVIVSWTVENPDRNTSTNRLQITETRNNNSITNVFSYNATSNLWELLSGNGTKKESKTEVWLSDTEKVVTRQVVNPSSGSVLMITKH